MILLDASQYRAETTQIVQDVFATMLGYTSEPGAQEDNSPAAPGGVTASVYFAGSWRGAATLECGAATARSFCARLMKIPEPGDVDEDTLDTLGELINMVGGNLKSILPREIVLSPPAVSFGAGANCEIYGETSKAVFGFTCEAGPFQLTLVHLPGVRR